MSTFILFLFPIFVCAKNDDKFLWKNAQAEVNLYGYVNGSFYGQKCDEQDILLLQSVIGNFEQDMFEKVEILVDQPDLLQLQVFASIPEAFPTPVKNLSSRFDGYMVDDGIAASDPSPRATRRVDSNNEVFVNIDSLKVCADSEIDQSFIVNILYKIVNDALGKVNASLYKSRNVTRIVKISPEVLFKEEQAKLDKFIIEVNSILKCDDSNRSNIFDPIFLSFYKSNHTSQGALIHAKHAFVNYIKKLFSGFNYSNLKFDEDLKGEAPDESPDESRIARLVDTIILGLEIVESAPKIFKRDLYQEAVINIFIALIKKDLEKSYESYDLKKMDRYDLLIDLGKEQLFQVLGSRCMFKLNEEFYPSAEMLNHINANKYKLKQYLDAVGKDLDVYLVCAHLKLAQDKFAELYKRSDFPLKSASFHEVLKNLKFCKVEFECNIPIIVINNLFKSSNIEESYTLQFRNVLYDLRNSKKPKKHIDSINFLRFLIEDAVEIQNALVYALEECNKKGKQNSAISSLSSCPIRVDASGISIGKSDGVDKKSRRVCI